MEEEESEEDTSVYKTKGAIYENGKVQNPIVKLEHIEEFV